MYNVGRRGRSSGASRRRLGNGFRMVAAASGNFIMAADVVMTVSMHCFAVDRLNVNTNHIRIAFVLSKLGYIPSGPRSGEMQGLG